MSRSRRKALFVSNAICRSEKQDKRSWHKRWRCAERTALASATTEDLEAHAPVPARAVSDPLSMGKDGRSYWPKSSRERVARRIAGTGHCDLGERTAKYERLLRKWVAK